MGDLEIVRVADVTKDARNERFYRYQAGVSVDRDVQSERLVERPFQLWIGVGKHLAEVRQGVEN